MAKAYKTKTVKNKAENNEGDLSTSKETSNPVKKSLFMFLNKFTVTSQPYFKKFSIMILILLTTSRRIAKLNNPL